MIYFLKPIGEKGPIKIGCSSMPQERLKAVQIWSPVFLEIVAIVDGHVTLENFLHRHFLADRLHGEWFAWSEELQSVLDHAVTHGDLPEWVKPPRNPAEWRAFIEKYPKGKPRRPKQAA